MKRREFIGLIGGVLAASNSSQRVEAQQFNKLPFLGVLMAEAAPHSFPDAFQAGLQSLGYSVVVTSRSNGATPTGFIACRRKRQGIGQAWRQYYCSPSHTGG
jgi:hypothetical protein